MHGIEGLKGIGEIADARGEDVLGLGSIAWKRR
jgi:hypothetical protein